MKKSLIVFVFLIASLYCYSQNNALVLLNTRWTGTDGEIEYSVSFLTSEYCTIEATDSSPLKCKYIWNSIIEKGTIDKNENDIYVISIFNDNNIILSDGFDVIVLTRISIPKEKVFLLKQTKWIGLEDDELYFLEFISINKFTVRQNNNEGEEAIRNYMWNEKTKKGFIDSEDQHKIELTALNNLRIETKQDDGSFYSQYFVRDE